MMCMHKHIIYAIIIVNSFIIEKINCLDQWSWGKAIMPAQDQASMATSYKRSELKKLPLEAMPDDASHHVGAQGLLFLGLKVPPSPPKPCNIRRVNNHVSFDLSDSPVLTEVVNSDLNQNTFSQSTGAEEILPITPTDPKYLGHGVLFSIFRSMDNDDKGNANGKLVVGTAFLVSPHCIITAAHNVVLSSYIRNLLQCEHLSPYAESVEFWPLMNGFTPEMFDGKNLKDGGTRAVSVKLPQRWDPQGLSCVNYDFAVLKLSQPLGRTFGCCPSQITIPSQINSKNIFVSGYQSEGSDISFILTQCEGTITDPHNVKNKAFYFVQPVTKKGQSGSGLRLVAADNSHVIIGTHTTAESVLGVIKGGSIAFTTEVYKLIGDWVTAFES